ncbi:PAS domain-containing protein [Brevundimonas sp.]|uniref:PAS domain-containing protein n=1 Tax=Brevundimonas sp. TaxID=1871086 RepID=UPI0035AE7BC1
MPSSRATLRRQTAEPLNLDRPLDRLTGLASAIFGMPYAMVSVVDGDQTLFRVNVGEKDLRLPRHQTITDLLMSMGPEGLFIVEDGLADERVRNHPMVTGEPFLRSYVGVTVVNAAGEPVGAIGVMSPEPHPAPTPQQIDILRKLAGLVGHELDTACTLRKAAEQTAMLEMSEALAGLGHWRYDLIDKGLEWSDQVYRIHGTEPGSFVPSLAAMEPLYHPADRDEGQRLIQRAMTTGEGYDTRLRLIVDGEERVSRSTARVERDEHGRIVALFGVAQDVTETVRAERAQQELVETLKLAEDMAGIGSWRLDVATGHVRWSPQVYRIHGLDPETFDPALDDAVACYHPDDREAVREWCAKAIASGQPDEFRLRLIRADGQERIVVSQCRPQVDPHGQTVSLFGVFQDVTEAVRAHETIKASEARYRLLADNATDIIATYGIDGRFRYVSPSIEGVLGYSAEELVGEPCARVMHPDDVAPVMKAFADYVEAAPDAPSPRIPYRGLSKGGVLVWLEAHPKLIRDDQGRPIEFHDVVRDISDTKALEDALIAARDRAEEGARAKSEFLANMSHELRTPLTSVVGFSGLLLSSEALPETERRYVDRIATASDALLGVINDILDYSKLEAGAVTLEPLAFSAEAMARSAASIVEAQCEAKGLALEVVVDPAMPETMIGDEGRLRQVTLNFLANAVKFTAKGSVSVQVGWTGERLRVAVTDTGIGVSQDKIASMFERFTQADNSTTRVYGGTGLGLSISRRLIEMMGGEIGADSCTNEGSTFWFEVPLVAGERRAERRVQTPVIDNPSSGLKILVADDAPANRELVTAILGSMGVEVHAVADGVEAVEAARLGGYDLILMDVHMPVLDGLDATRAIRALDGPVARTPIIALTANVQPEQVERCREAGMDDHCGKPIQLAELIRVMSARLERRAVDRGGPGRLAGAAA